MSEASGGLACRMKTPVEMILCACPFGGHSSRASMRAKNAGGVDKEDAQGTREGCGAHGS